MPAKRKENKITKDNITTDIYNYYRKYSKNPVSRDVFVAFLFGDDGDITLSNGIYPTIVRKIVEGNFHWKMPYSFGVLSVGKYKGTIMDKKGRIRQPRNYQAEWVYWREKYEGKTDEEIAKIPNKPKIYLDNDDTNGFKYSFRWDKSGCNIRNNSAYKLKMQRVWDRYIPKKVRDPNFKTDYYLL